MAFDAAIKKNILHPNRRRQFGDESKNCNSKSYHLANITRRHRPMDFITNWTATDLYLNLYLWELTT